jgi:hypothetical protein
MVGHPVIQCRVTKFVGFLVETSWLPTEFQRNAQGQKVLINFSDRIPILAIGEQGPGVEVEDTTAAYMIDNIRGISAYMI